MIDSSTRPPILLNLLKSLRKNDKMLYKSRILSLFLNSLINSILPEGSCYILYIFLSLGSYTVNMLTERPSSDTFLCSI